MVCKYVFGAATAIERSRNIIVGCAPARGNFLDFIDEALTGTTNKLFRQNQIGRRTVVIRT